jgi:MGT family glycosyltransferase
MGTRKALFIGLPLHGHVNPSLPLVRALAERGEQVVYYATAPFATAIERAGATFRAYRTECLSDLTPMTERLDALSWFMTTAIRDVLVNDLEGFRAERPDYVITDSVAPWGQWAGQILDVPVITSIPTFAVNRHVFAFAAASGTRPKSVQLVISKIRHVVKAVRLGARLRRQYDVKGTGIVGLTFGSSALNIVHTSRQFQPCAETFDERFLFIGPSVESRTESQRLTWNGASDGRLIYVSLGTIFNTDAGFYRDCLAALRDDDVRVIVAIGKTVSAESLGGIPPNVTVAPWVPQLDVLRRASLFVSHGGMNSVSESLHYGVPLVVVPQMGEQELVAAQVQRLGAGVQLPRHRVTPASLRAAVQGVLNDRTFRDRAVEIGDSFKAAGGASRAAEAVLAFSRGSVALSV